MSRKQSLPPFETPEEERAREIKTEFAKLVEIVKRDLQPAEPPPEPEWRSETEIENARMRAAVEADWAQNRSGRSGRRR